MGYHDETGEPLAGARVRSGDIIPRDYGVFLRVAPRETVFVTPLAYALGKLILERPGEIRRRIAEKAGRDGISVSELTEAFVRGVIAREGTKNALNYSGRSALTDVMTYGRVVTAKVKSKGRGQPAYYDVQLTRSDISRRSPSLDEDLTSSVSRRVDYGYTRPRCSCKGRYWSDVKMVQTVDAHIAALESALFLDDRSHAAAHRNLTGLPPSQRPAVPFMPFAFLAHDAYAQERDALLTDMLCAYYVDGRQSFSINKEALGKRVLFSDALVAAIRCPWQRARFGVVRHDERSVATDDLAISERRVLRAASALEERIIGLLRDHAFRSDGYALEFRDSAHETVAKRFRKRDVVYALCRTRESLPIIVSKRLGRSALDPFATSDGSDEHPLLRAGEKAYAVDDATRRECLFEAIIPGEREDAAVFVPQLLKMEYKRAVARAKAAQE